MSYCQHCCDPYFGIPSIPEEFEGKYNYYSDSDNSEDERKDEREDETIMETFQLFNADGENNDMKKYKKFDDNKHKLLCGFPVVAGSTKCIFHKCQKDGCDNSKKYKYCEEHQCKWKYCKELACDNSKYCVKHKCLTCDSYVMYDYVQYCKEHLTGTPCNFDGCQGIVTTEGQTYCGKHKCKECNNCVWTVGTHLCHQCIEKDPDWKHNGAEFRSFLTAATDEERRYIGLCASGRKCIFKHCRHEKMEDVVELGDLIFSSDYCMLHHFLNELCKNNYKFGLEHVSCFDVIDDGDVVQDSPKIMAMKEIYKLALSLCK